MEKINNNQIRLVKIDRRHCTFEVGGVVAFANARVANDIVVHKTDAFLERDVEVGGHIIGNWLSTPSRFN